MKALPLILLLALNCPLHAQTARTDHIIGLDNGAKSPPASLEDMTFLAGSWTGEAFGGTFEEVWTKPANGSMVGLFKLVHEGETSIYEIQTITVEEGSLVWKVKHFGSNFEAWEEKDEHVTFRLVKIEPDAAYFDGITLRRDGANLIAYLLVTNEGEVREEKLVYHPSPLP